jgi:Zn-finger protein
MGGRGSGRRWQGGADTTDDYRSIDIRWLKREGLLGSEDRRRITWSRGGRVTGGIDLQSEPGRLILDYRHRERGGEWKAERYPVHLDTTPCTLGGVRHWFLCPARGCGRRVAILYGGAIFACRHCHRLVHGSQRENPADRAARRADRIRDRLGWPGGILEGGDWGRPKGMHHRTYERLCREHDGLSARALAGIMDHLS